MASPSTASTRKRRLAILVAVAIVAGILVWRAPSPEAGDPADLAIVKSPRKSNPASSAAAAGPGEAESLTARIARLSHRGDSSVAVSDLFGPEAARQETPEAPPPPPKPTAPPFPYTFLGALQDGLVRTVFLSSPDRVIPVREKDTIDGIYRIERITPESMVVTYLPLKEKQTISLRGVS